jgi:CRP-like cAMP-binding protein
VENQSHPCFFCELNVNGLCAVNTNESIDLEKKSPSFNNRNIEFGVGRRIFDEFSRADRFYILKQGWVAIFHLLADGSRQIVRFVLPGELFGLEADGAEVHSSTAEAITAGAYCAQNKNDLIQRRRDSLSYSERFITLMDRERQILTNDLTNIGRRDSLARVAFFLVELAVRSSQTYPVVEGVDYRIPLFQRMIADATGLTVIHVNRTLSRLRSEGYLDFHDGRMRVLDSARLDKLLKLGSATQFSLEQLAKPI